MNVPPALYIPLGLVGAILLVLVCVSTIDKRSPDDPDDWGGA
jgi:hypothetical protein